MKNLIFILLVTAPSIGTAESGPPPPPPFPDNNPNANKIYSQGEAITITEGAILQRDDVKLLSRDAESWGWKQMKYLGLTKEIVSPAAVVAAPIFQKKLSTEAVCFHCEPVNNLTLRPDIEYYFRSKETNTIFTLGWKF